MKKFTAAVIQMDSGNDVDQNLKELERFIEEAAEKNAKLIAMPENVNYVGRCSGRQNILFSVGAGSEIWGLASLRQHL